MMPEASDVPLAGFRQGYQTWRNPDLGQSPVLRRPGPDAVETLGGFDRDDVVLTQDKGLHQAEPPPDFVHVRSDDGWYLCRQR